MLIYAKLHLKSRDYQMIQITWAIYLQIKVVRVEAFFSTQYFVLMPSFNPFTPKSKS